MSALQVLHTSLDGTPVTEADAFMEALHLLQLSNNSVIWGKSDELVTQVYEVWVQQEIEV